MIKNLTEFWNLAMAKTYKEIARLEVENFNEMVKKVPLGDNLRRLVDVKT